VKRLLNVTLHLLALSALAIVCGVLLKSHALHKPVEEVNVMNKNPGISITIVYDNNAQDSRLTTDWGFACVIKTPARKILFDTGGDGTILLSNMKKLGLDPKKIDIVFLSHIHSDHVGGLTDILRQNPNVIVYYPHSFPKEFKGKISSAGAKAVAIDQPQQIATGIYTTGEMGGPIKEQSLVVQTTQGLLIITGCSHPGIVEIIKRAEEIGKAKPYLVLGGFHLKGANDFQLNVVVDAFKSFGVKKVGSAHCSGDHTRALFKQAYGSGYIPAGVGTVVSVSE